MSKFLLTFNRSAIRSVDSEQMVQRCLAAVMDCHGSSRIDQVHVLELSSGMVCGLAPHSAAIQCQEIRGTTGQETEQTSNWILPGGSPEGGSCVTVCANQDSMAVVADAMATRTIWYFHDAEIFIASNSQRALLMFLGSFEPNSRAIPWMLANGIPGPPGGWDSRLQFVPPGGQVSLNRKRWELKLTKGPDEFSPLHLPDNAHRARFREAVDDSVNRLQFDTQRWLLPLSGGYDSRLLACLLRGREGLQSVTWGISPTACDKDSEGAIAVELASSLGIRHEYLPVHPNEQPIDVVMERFVRMSEGRTDGLGAYLDGFRMWEELAESGVEAIIRGDEAFGGFGWSPVYSERDVRAGLGLGYISENPSLLWLKNLDGMAQQLPDSLALSPSESLDTWRYRLYHDFRVPVALSALNETKSAFVDVVNPLQFRAVVDVVRRLPDHLRKDKYLLIDLVNRLSPKVPYSKLREGDLMLRTLRRSDTVEFLRDELDSVFARSVLGQEAVKGILKRMPFGALKPDEVNRPPTTRRLSQRARASIPRSAKRLLKRFAPPAPVDPCALAFRAWIVVRVQKLLADDAAALR